MPLLNDKRGVKGGEEEFCFADRRKLNAIKLFTSEQIERDREQKIGNLTGNLDHEGANSCSVQPAFSLQPSSTKS